MIVQISEVKNVSFDIPGVLLLVKFEMINNFVPKNIFSHHRLSTREFVMKIKRTRSVKFFRKMINIARFSCA